MRRAGEEEGWKMERKRNQKRLERRREGSRERIRDLKRLRWDDGRERVNMEERASRGWRGRGGGSWIEVKETESRVGWRWEV